MDNNSYKPNGYNCLSPYLVVDQAEQVIDQLKSIFHAEELRRYEDGDGRIVHAELKILDSVLMLSNSTDQYPAKQIMMHLYVPDVHQTFEKVKANGCKIIKEPIQEEGDPDIRAAFYDMAGNYWAIGTQQ